MSGKYAVKCDDQHQNKAILEAEIVSNPENFPDNSPMSHCPSVTTKNIGARKLLFQHVLYRRDYSEIVVSSFHTKCNLNTMAETNMCILNSLQ